VKMGECGQSTLNACRKTQHYHLLKLF
jgi:hypothetical protein